MASCRLVRIKGDLMTKLVFSYSHVDEELRNELEKHLSPLKRMGRIEPWHDRRITPGDEFDAVIDRNFADADFILLLVSPDFIASDYCFNIEMQNSLERHEQGEAVVIPVILRPCAWHQLPFGKLLAAPTDGKPIIQFPTVDEGFVQVVEAVSSVLDRFEAESTSGYPQENTPMDSAPWDNETGQGRVVSRGPRSSNLAIQKEFTDRDRDLACRDGFDYLVRFFENSLKELSARNPELETDFRQRDNDSFECSAYLNGKRVCHCGIWKAGQNENLGDICYSQNGITHNSCNDSMSVASDGAMLGFQALMGGMMGQARDEIMTAEGMAEYFWGQFLRPLK